MYPETEGQHGYFAYILISNLAYTSPHNPSLILSALSRRDLVVHKVGIAALTQATSPRSPVYLAVCLGGGTVLL